MNTSELIAPGPTTVLIVDDEAVVRQLVDRMLRGAGYLTKLAANGADALVNAEGPDRIDLLLTDMMMPGMNGDEVARQLRRHHPALKVLYYTGASEHRVDGKEPMRADEAFLAKPCSAKRLLEACSALCGGPRAVRAK